MTKETYSYGTRGLFIWPGRPTSVAQKKAYPQGKRDPFKKKRASYTAREADSNLFPYLWQKKGIFTWQEDAPRRSKTLKERPIQKKRTSYTTREADSNLFPYLWQKKGIFTWRVERGRQVGNRLDADALPGEHLHRHARQLRVLGRGDKQQQTPDPSPLPPPPPAVRHNPLCP